MSQVSEETINIYANSPGASKVDTKRFSRSSKSLGVVDNWLESVNILPYSSSITGNNLFSSSSNLEPMLDGLKGVTQGSTCPLSRCGGVYVLTGHSSRQILDMEGVAASFTVKREVAYVVDPVTKLLCDLDDDNSGDHLRDHIHSPHPIFHN